MRRAIVGLMIGLLLFTLLPVGLAASGNSSGMVGGTGGGMIGNDKQLPPPNQVSETKPPAEEAPPVIEKGPNAVINWTKDYIEATGSAVPPSNVKNKAQGVLLAKRGAILDLQRNLLEAIKGVRIDSKTVMNNFMAQDWVKSEVHGWIKGVRIIKSEWDPNEGIYTVTGRIYLKGVRDVVAKIKKIPSRPPREIPKAKYNYSGLVLDARNVPLIPATLCKILDPKGKEVYSINFVDRERFMASGLVAYQTNINYAKGDPRVATRPLVVKVVKTVSPNNVDMVIPMRYAQIIRHNKFDFRSRCRVIVVKR